MEVVYIGLKTNINRLVDSHIRVGDVAEIHIQGRNCNELMDLVIKKVKPGWQTIQAVDVVKVLYQKLNPETRIEMIGEKRCMVQGMPVKQKRRAFKFVTALFLAVLMFLGGALTLMNFHADVSMPEVHAMLSTMITGDQDISNLWINIPYSIGIALGVLIFTGIGKKRSKPNLFEIEEQEYRTKVEKHLQQSEAGEAEDD